MEADKLGLDYIRATEYELNGMVDLLHKMKSVKGDADDGFFAAHPSYEDRFELFQNANLR